ncbi:MAG: 3-dehydroquinate synthase [Alphaproteobacteria bacterium]|nr:3-dehydroquinate synthase [Alphaproteobacteria bacterium]
MPLKNCQTIRVDLGESRSYDIMVGSRLIEFAGKLIEPHLKRPFTIIVTDENVAEQHLADLQASFGNQGIECDAIILPAGEKSKSMTMLATLLEKLIAYGVERSDVITVLGGGVIGDLAGFAAATLRRGVDFIQIPTSILAQVDSSVGGKTGINSPQGKNLIGAFHQPKLVLADIDILDTLSDRHICGGYAEIFKYALINDPEFYNWLLENGEKLINGDKAARQYAVVKSCQSKANIVAQDEKEHGLRALLNLGHTFGHALEAHTQYSDRLIHGEGVAIGMVLAFEFSSFLGFNNGADIAAIKQHMQKIGLPNDLSFEGLQPLPSAKQMLKYMLQDKKTEQGEMTFILANAVGKSFVEKNVDQQLVTNFLKSKSFK